MQDNWRIAIRKFVDELGLSSGSAESILTEDLCLKRVSVKSVPKLLTVESYLVQNFLVKHQIPQVAQPPYSPDVVPYDFLFPKIKMLKGNSFQEMEMIKRNVMKQLLAIPNSQFQKCFEQWKDRWKKCVLSEGDCGA
jgi:transposase